ncbi:MAG TPA: hypothetical protein VE544_07180 [Nitrososphaeraceae archaeon]|nr:hypothetical protein [Nitrososphaeraceae archaeon]
MTNVLYSPSSGLETRPPHEYIRETLAVSYHDCKSCKNRTKFFCIRCGYCYSCHWKKEEAEKSLFSNKLDEIFSDSSLSKHVEQKSSVKQRKSIVDVYGRISEPICSYHGCEHKFSVHGLGSCRCRHPSNKTLGILARYT